MSTAWMFPGQGSQQRTMRDSVERARPDLLDAAVELVGCDPFEEIDRGTAYQQPAIYCASLAALGALDEQQPDCYAGHSLGEITALAAAGALDERDGLRLVALRGKLMQRVNDAAGGAMLAVAASVDVVRQLASAHGVTLAVDNAPSQAVLAGDADAIAGAQVDAKARGLKTSRLPIQVAAHTPALAVVAAELRALLDEIDVREPRRPCYSCVIAGEFDDVRVRLAQSLTCAVRWREVLLALRGRGVSRFVDIGPGRALIGLARATLDDEIELVSAQRLLTADA
jgi:acyl transferase domain-containing protein